MVVVQQAHDVCVMRFTTYLKVRATCSSQSFSDLEIKHKKRKFGIDLWWVGKATCIHMRGY